jgi:hypothetical protein
VFGSAWHYGLEVVYEEMMKDTKLDPTSAREASIKGFNALWSIEGEPNFDPDLVYPKSPGRAADMYHKYWKQFLVEDTALKIVGVEIPFTITLSDLLPGMPNYIGRMDLAFEHEDESLEILDHKSASSINKITPVSFQASMQTDGYLAAGHLYYDKIPSMTYSVALCQKTKIAFERFTFSKRLSAINRFLVDLANHCNRLLGDLTLMEQELEEHATDRNHIMSSFYRKPGYACTSFFAACPYFDICNHRNNPLTWTEDIPGGYERKEWDPATHEAELKKKLEEIR